MTSWNDLERQAPDLAERARAAFTATTNAVLGTLRADGSPRLSGIDPMFLDGEIWLGSMPGARKGRDLRRDARMALHCVPWESRRESPDGPAPQADAKLSGRAERVTDRAVLARVFGHHAEDTGYESPDDADLFRIDIDAVTTIWVEDPQLVIDRWSAIDGRTTTRRS